MSDPLDGVRWKLWLASEHHKTLNSEIKRFLESGFYEVSGEQDRQGRLVERFSRVDPVPDSVGLFAGACAHELRCALDHLMFALANPADEREEGQVQFPIVSKGKLWRNTRYRMPGVRRGVRTITESLQPYHRRKWPETYLLWKLRRIDDWDKHRMLPATILSLKETRLTVHIEGKTSVRREMSYTGPLKPNAVIARLEMGQSEVGATVRMDKQFVMRELFDKGAPKEVRGLGIRMTLTEIAGFIENEVVPRLQPFV